MSKFYFLSLSALCIVTLGAGCSSIDNNNLDDDTFATKSAQEDIQNTSSIKDTPVADDQIILRGEATMSGTIQLNWQAGENLQTRVESWRLLHGQEINPEYPSDWWYERGPSHMEKEWSGLPSGPAHIRVCAVIHDACAVYSNDLEVDIK